MRAGRGRDGRGNRISGLIKAAFGGAAGAVRLSMVVADTGCWTLQIVKRSDARHFVVLPAEDCRANAGAG